MSDMDKSTLKALRGSIKKWEKIVDGSGADDGPANCPLCQKFFKNSCDGCPVAKKTESIGCFDTPFDDWDYLCNKEGIDEGPPIKTSDFKNKRKAIAIAKREVKFLKSLLPEGAK